MCNHQTCEGTYGSFSARYRLLARMQTASSIETLESLWKQAMEKRYTDTYMKSQYNILKERWKATHVLQSKTHVKFDKLLNENKKHE